MLGHPVAHSLSPAIHRTFYQRHAIDATFDPVDVPPAEFPAWRRSLAGRPYAGLSVTFPYKQDIAHALAELDSLARDLDAVNCLVPLDTAAKPHQSPSGLETKDSGLPYLGHNTDGEGFCLFLERELTFTLTGRTVLMLGAGASAKSVARSILSRNPRRLTILNRGIERLREPFFAALQTAGAHLGQLGTVDYMEGAWPRLLAETDLFVHATPFGLAGTGAAEPLPDGVWNIPSTIVVVDLNYRFRERTPFLARLERVSRVQPERAHDGKGMLLHQAAEAFRLWFGYLPDTSGMLARLGA